MNHFISSLSNLFFVILIHSRFSITSKPITNSSHRVFYLTNIFNSKPTINKLTTTRKLLTSQSTSTQPVNKNPPYEIDYKPERLNELMMLAYQNSFYKNNSQFLDQLFQQFLTNMTKSKLIDENINVYKQANAINREKLFMNNLNIKYLATKPGFGYEYLQATKTIAKTTSNATKLKSNYGCENLPDGEFVRDPEDCSSFFTCFTGKATKKSTCNSGLFFDSKIRVCNWKANVVCSETGNKRSINF